MDARTVSALVSPDRPPHGDSGGTYSGHAAHPQQGYRLCLGILRLGKAYRADRLEAACQRALAIGG